MTFAELALDLICQGQNVYLHAGGGYGKSVSLVHLYQKILAQNLVERGKQLVPLYVSASACKIESYGIRKYLARNYYGVGIYSEKDFIQYIDNYDSMVLNNTDVPYRFVIIIDGINETGSGSQFLSEINHLAEYCNVSVVVSGRDLVSEYWKFNNFKIVSLSTLPSTIVNKTIPWIDKLPNWACTPFYITLIKRAHLKSNDFATEFQLLDAYFDFSVGKLIHQTERKPIFKKENDDDKSGNFYDDMTAVVSQVFPLLCTKMMKSMRMDFSLEDTAFIKQIADAFIGQVYDLGVKEIYKICEEILCPLGVLAHYDNSKSFVYRISHQIFLDYFAAENMLRLNESGFDKISELLSGQVAEGTLRFFVQGLDTDRSEILHGLNEYIGRDASRRSDSALNANAVKLFSYAGPSIENECFANRNLTDSDFCSFDEIKNTVFDGSKFGPESLPLKYLPIGSSMCFSKEKGRLFVENDVCVLAGSHYAYRIDPGTGRMTERYDIDAEDLESLWLVDYLGQPYLAIPSVDYIQFQPVDSNLPSRIIRSEEMWWEPHYINGTGYASSDGHLFAYDMDAGITGEIAFALDVGGNGNQCFWFLDEDKECFIVQFKKNCYTMEKDEYRKLFNHTKLNRNFGNSLLGGCLQPRYCFEYQNNLVLVLPQAVIFKEEEVFFTENVIVGADWVDEKAGLLLLLLEVGHLLILDLDTKETTDPVPVEKKICLWIYPSTMEYPHFVLSNGNRVAVACEEGIQLFKRQGKNLLVRGRFIPLSMDWYSNIFTYKQDFIVFSGEVICRINPNGKMVWVKRCNEESTIDFYHTKSHQFLANRGPFPKVVSLEEKEISIRSIETPYEHGGYHAMMRFHVTELNDVIFSDGLLNGPIVYILRGDQYQKYFKLSESPYSFPPVKNSDALIDSFECKYIHLVDSESLVTIGECLKDGTLYKKLFCILLNSQLEFRELFSIEAVDGKDMMGVYYEKTSEFLWLEENAIYLISCRQDSQSYIDIPWCFPRERCLEFSTGFDKLEAHIVYRNADTLAFLLGNKRDWFILKVDLKGKEIEWQPVFDDRQSDFLFLDVLDDNRVLFWAFNSHQLIEVTILGNNHSCRKTDLKIYPDGSNIHAHKHKIYWKEADSEIIHIYDIKTEKMQALYPYLQNVTGSSFKNTNLNSKELEILQSYGADTLDDSK